MKSYQLIYNDKGKLEKLFEPEEFYVAQQEEAAVTFVATFPAFLTGSVKGYAEHPGGGTVTDCGELTFNQHQARLTLHSDQLVSDYLKVGFEVFEKEKGIRFEPVTVAVDRFVNPTGTGAGQHGYTVTVSAGTVTLIEPEEIPWVENAGTLKDAVFHFGLPRPASPAELMGEYGPVLSRSFANAIRGQQNDIVVEIDDASPLNHELDLRIHPVNHYKIDDYIEENGQYGISARHLKNGITYTLSSLLPLEAVMIATPDYMTGTTDRFCIRQTSFEQNDSGFSWFTFTYDWVEEMGDVADAYIWIIDKSQTTLTDLEALRQLDICIVEGTEPTDPDVEIPPFADSANAGLVVCKSKNLFNPNARLINTPNQWYQGVSIDSLVKKHGHDIWLSISPKNGKVFSNTSILFGFCMKNIDNDNAYAVWMIQDGELKRNTAIQPSGAYENFSISVYPATQEAWDEVMDCFDIQLEVTTAPTGYVPFEGAEYQPDADGVIHDVQSSCSTMRMYPNAIGSSGIGVSCEYNKDTNKVINDLIQKIENL